MGIPTLLQRVLSGQDGATAQNATPNCTLQMALPNLTKWANTLVLYISYWSGGTLTSVTDDMGNVWNLAKSVSDGTNSTNFAIYYAQWIAAGTRVVTANFSNHPGLSANSNIVGHLSEWCNVGAFDGVNSVTGATASPYSSGSVTTTQNGDLVLSYVSPVWNSGSVTLQDISAGSNFALMGATNMMGGSTSNGFAASYSVQTTAGAINPSTTMAGTNGAANQTVEAMTIAFQAADVGSLNTTSPRITDVQMIFLSNGGTQKKQINSPFPCDPACNAIVATINTAGNNIASITDSLNGSWQLPANSIGINTTSTDRAQIGYVLNATCTRQMTISIDLGAAPAGDPIMVVYGVVGLSAFDVAANANGNDTISTAGSPLSTVSITPTNANEMIFVSLAISWNDIQSMACSGESPVLVSMINANLADGISGNSPLCEDNGHGYLLNATGGSKTFTFNGTHTDVHASGGFGQWAAGAAAFTVQSAASVPPTKRATETEKRDVSYW